MNIKRSVFATLSAFVSTLLVSSSLMASPVGATTQEPTVANAQLSSSDHYLARRGSPKGCAPVCDPCAPSPCQDTHPRAKQASRSQHNTSSMEHCGVRVTAKQPQLCMQGDSYALDVEVEACRDVCGVSVKAMLPEGVSLIRSNPEGVVDGGHQIKWQIDGMKRGEKITNRLTLRADREGDICVCFCVTAVPVQFCSMLCAKPQLCCKKTGPCEVCPGDPVRYCISVTNKGSCTAEDVVVTDNVPPELEHSSGQKMITMKLGDIEPGCTKNASICFTAVKRGKACNTIIVTACNASQCTDTFCTNICKECVELTKSGPKEVKIGQNATYEIVVTNPGDKPLTQVIVCDNAPNGTSIVEARGASVSGNQASWKFQELQPGEKKVLELTLTSCSPGYYVNRVSVNNCQRCCAQAEAGTRWKGTPALNVQIADLEDPVCVGDPTSYIIRIVNQGSEEDMNVTTMVRFPKEIMPQSVSGPTSGRINGQTVSFTPANILAPRQVLEYRVDGVAKEPGDARVKAEVISDSIRTPITQEESTIIN